MAAKIEWSELDPASARDRGLVHETLAPRRDGTVPYRRGRGGLPGPRIAVIPRAADCGGGWWVVLWVGARLFEEGAGLRALYDERWRALEAARLLDVLVRRAGWPDDDEGDAELEALVREAVRSIRHEVATDAMGHLAPGSFGSGRRR